MLHTKKSVLPKQLTKRLAIEMGPPLDGTVMLDLKVTLLQLINSVHSAPGEIVMKEYGFSVENVVSKMKNLLQK